MKETMGQIIKRLRKERNFTQEELAEQLGVTFQAVSRWENDSGMPDISQIVPLATVFDVSTDVLFGMYGTNNDEEVRKIIQDAYAPVTSPATKESVLCRYNALIEGLSKYPNNTALLSQCLEAGISLAYPENDTYDSENAKRIYRECIRYADLVIKYGKNTTDVLRAHMIMVLLHSAHGDMQSAREHAEHFPWRCDMTVHEMSSYIAHFEKDYRAEGVHCQTDFMYHFEAMLDDIVQLACCHYHLGNYDDTRFILNEALGFITLLCRNEELVPCLHYRERGDIYALLAEVELKVGNIDEAIRMLEKMVDYDLTVCPKYPSGQRLHTPLLRDVDYDYYAERPNVRERLLAKLSLPAFGKLKGNSEFEALMERVGDSGN